MKKVVIDCRYLGMSGIGRFLEGVLKKLDYTKNEYILWGNEKMVKKYSQANYIFDSSSPFDSKNMFKYPKKQINKADIFFSPDFIYPYGLKPKSIMMLHDIIFLDLPSVNSSFIEKIIKKHLIKRCLKKCSSLLTVSKFSKDRINYFFPKYDHKISYYYQSISDDFKNREKLCKENYIIYVGNVKIHKGIRTLIDAYKIVEKINPDLKLYIVGERDKFKNGDKKLDTNDKNIHFTGRISDEELKELIAKARFLVQPSYYEGFGLPPLEAMYLGTRPILSDIPVFKEVYSTYDVVFFENKNADDLAKKILESDCKFDFDIVKANKEFDTQKFVDAIESMIDKL